VLQLRTLHEKPFHRIRYLNAARGGRTETQTLLFERGVVTGLPHDIDALVLTSDHPGDGIGARHGRSGALGRRRRGGAPRARRERRAAAPSAARGDKTKSQRSL